MFVDRLQADRIFRVSSVFLKLFIFMSSDDVYLVLNGASPTVLTTYDIKSLYITFFYILLINLQ